jgi:hypothetical protein
MTFSSMFVLTNSLRLQRTYGVRPEQDEQEQAADPAQSVRAEST